MAWVYILKTKSDRYYVGSTTDINRRLKQHLEGHTPSTKKLGIEKLLFKQEFKTLDEARLIERKIKNLKRKDYIEKMIKDGYIKLTPK